MQGSDILPAHLRQLVAEVSREGFYRSWFRVPYDAIQLDIGSVDDWRALPLMRKETLVAAPFKERLYCSMADIEDGIVTTSGTTGGEPLFVARASRTGREFRRSFHDFERPILISPPPLPQRIEAIARTIHPDASVVTLDPFAIPLSLTLARAAGSRSLIMPTQMIRSVAPAMKEEGLGERMTSIELHGSSCTPALWRILTDAFPNAAVIQAYASNDVEGAPTALTLPIKGGTFSRPVFKANDGIFLELIGRDTQEPIEPEAGREGELVVTNILERPYAFPVIRYRTGDIVQVVDNAAAGYVGWSFSVLGRRDLDFIRVDKGVISSSSVERALREEFGDRLEDFEASCDDGERDGTVRLEIRIALSDSDTVAQHAPMIAEKIYVSPNYTYGDGVRDGVYAPLVCTEKAAGHEGAKPVALRRMKADRN